MFYMNDDNLPEVKEIFKQIMDQPDKMFDMLSENRLGRIMIKEICPSQ